MIIQWEFVSHGRPSRGHQWGQGRAEPFVISMHVQTPADPVTSKTNDLVCTAIYLLMALVSGERAWTGKHRDSAE